MILLLVVIAIAAFFIYADFAHDWDGAGITCGIIVLILISIFPLISYNTYLDMLEFRDGHYIEHKVKAIKELKKMIKNDDNLIAETKDGYYVVLSKGIQKLNNEVFWYNEEIISKRKMNDNIIFSWLIIAPDEDMKVIKSNEYQY